MSLTVFDVTRGLNMDAPRTWFATTPEGLTVVVRRFDLQGQPSSYEVFAYEGYVTASPKDVPLPADFPESLPSLEQAMRSIRQVWGLDASAFEDVRQSKSVAVDFIQALRHGELTPIRQGLSPHALVGMLGFPEAVMAIDPDSVCWFYGSVQMHLREGVLQSLEIDRGEGDFTSFRLDGWFLDSSVTRAQLEQKLRLHEIGYVEESIMGAQVIRTLAPAQHRGFVFDFYPEDKRVHAFYWNL
jgi:hypothetical protein